MKRKETTHKARRKVVLGFLLTIFLVLSVCAITYFSIDKLLNTAQNLSEPNDRVQQLNALLADVYQLDKVKGDFKAQGDSTVTETYLDLIEGRLEYLEKSANDSAELNHLKKINFNINELVVVYNGLKDVKKNLINRNFSQQALRSLETKIKRQEEINRLQSLGRIRFDHKIRRTKPVEFDLNNSKKSAADSGNGSLMSSEEMENLRSMFQQFRPQAGDDDSVDYEGNNTSDSILYAVKQFLLDINYQEQHLRSSLANLEGELTLKNKELIEEIQSLISNLQEDAIKESQQKNDSLYELAFDVSILLGVLILVGVLGTSAFIYSILTEIRKDESYREDLEVAKERSDKLAKAKQNFLANMSHEIRNPLHAIQGYNAAIKKTAMSPDQKDYVNMVGFAAETLSGIVNDILDLSKLEAGKISIEKSPFDPHKLFNSIKNSFELKANEKQIDFNWNVNLPKDKWIVGDELRVSQILNNLISNALKFTEHGKVEVSIDFEKKGFLSMKVEDTGIGMTEEFKENIFKEFNQGDGSINRRYGGTGLGLTIVKRMLELQKGEMELKSEVGEGTSIQLRIPSKLVEAEMKKAADNETSFDISQLNILLVDDDSVGLKFAKLLLESNGATVKAMQGGTKIRDGVIDEDYDIFLIDIQMPEVSGYDVLRLLRENKKYQDIPAIAMTANVFAKEKDEISNVGFDAIVLKPFKEEDLLNKIGEILNLEIIPKAKVLNKPSSDLSISGMSSYDTSDLRKFCMDDEEMLKEVLTDFCISTSNDLVDLDKFSEVNDWSEVLEIAHKLGSRLGQLKIKTATLARGLEHDLKEGDHSKASEMIEKIKVDTLQVIDRILKEYQLMSKID
ncbi:hybrid sensor histidine kinase/response regulator [Echinicola salinicaeni]|uniref:hybrid sensor histidine kinase/response regulator n=1 Tax=Echinicola salinicaeni TaxID=2762757 RepID=UPI00164739F0|nr:ATP-binding protein [Echinicola salinicaeni]